MIDMPVQDADEVIDLEIEESDSAVDQIYNPASTNAQSGVAVAQALQDYVHTEGTTLVFG